MFRKLLGYLRLALESFGILRRPEVPVSIYSYSEGSLGCEAPMLFVGGSYNSMKDPLVDMSQKGYYEPLIFRHSCGNLDEPLMPIYFGPTHRIPNPFDEPIQSQDFAPISGWREQPVWIDDELGVCANDTWAIDAWMLMVTGGKVGFKELLDAGFDFEPEFRKMIWTPPENEYPFRELMDEIALSPATFTPAAEELFDQLFPLEP